MTPDALREAGEGIWGSEWQRRMAEALDVNPRTIRYWANGDNLIPPGIPADLRAFLRDEIQRLQEVLRRLDDAHPLERP